LLPSPFSCPLPSSLPFLLCFSHPTSLSTPTYAPPPPPPPPLSSFSYTLFYPSSSPSILTLPSYPTVEKSYGEGDMQSSWVSPKNRALKVISANVQSLFYKLDDLRNVVDEIKPDVMAFTETWLTTDITDSEISLRGYQHFRKDRPSRGGGVIVYVTRKLTAIADINIPLRNVEVLSVTISAKYSRPLTISVVYRSPYQISDQNLILITELYKASEKEDVLIVGDFDAPGIDWRTWTAQRMPDNFNHKLLQWATDKLLCQN
uniref:Endo/exonuclease/phosphatase domain-containing protein n=1 Tax=Schistocephalus solidus TaxID=70667 RepID=A0A183S9X8_SCHSO